MTDEKQRACMLCRADLTRNAGREFIVLPARADETEPIIVGRSLGDGGQFEVALGASAHDIVLCWPECFTKTIEQPRDDMAREVARMIERGELPNPEETDA